MGITTCAVLGVWALVDIFGVVDYMDGPVSGMALLIGGAVDYVVLLGVTGGPLHRPVTSELFIIVLWATVALLEINTLVGMGSASAEVGRMLAVLCTAGAAGSLVCYQLFYGLEAGAALRGSWRLPRTRGRIGPASVRLCVVVGDSPARADG